MCGIAGKVDFSGRPVDRTALARMTDLVKHRGPDAEGHWFRDAGRGPAVAFGHRRLSVLDLSDCAAQPMHNTGCVAAGSATPLVLVFNGEIYNYAELRAQLIARGHRLVSHTDSEVILHLYEERGPECVSALRGMFAFAIWDEAGGRLVCARDRVGKKPLYFRHDGERFWFASEVRAIIADPDVPIEADHGVIRTYLRLGFVAGSQSAFAGIRRLPPAHIAIVDRNGIRESRYWNLEYEPKRQMSAADAVEELSHRLREAVRLRLVSDVPLGAFLSGGIDSSAVVAMMCDEQAAVETFAIGFDDAAYNELPHAREVASRFGTAHQEFIVRPDAVDVAQKLAWHYGEPYADSSAVPTYYLAQLARSRITVALNGDGGDESFAGYTRYIAHRGAVAYQRVPRSVRSALEGTMARLSAGSAKSKTHRIRRFFQGASHPAFRRHAAWFEFFESEGDLLDPLSGGSASDDDGLAPLRVAFQQREHLDPVDAALAADVSVYLPDDLLVKVDIATMAHGLEARSPFLDHELMEFAARLPVRLKLRGRQKKWLLRRTLRGRLPDRVLDRPKMGFGVPLDNWFRTSLVTFANDLLRRPGAGRGYLRAGAVESLLDEHQSGRAAHGQRLWALLMLELWHQTYLDATRPAAETPIEADY